MNDKQVGAALPTNWKFEGADAWDSARAFEKEIDETYGFGGNITEHGQNGPCTVSIARDSACAAIDSIAQKLGGRAEARTR